MLLTIDGPRTDVADLTTYTYDTKGNVATLKNAVGKITKFSLYDANGRLKQMIDPNGLVTAISYDGRGNLIELARGTETTRYDYDNVGQLKVITLPTAATIEYKYDEAHRLTDIENDAGERMHFTLNAAGKREREDVFNALGTLVQTQSATFTPLGQLHHAIDAYNNRTVSSHDSNGNVVSVEDPLNRIVNFQIDSFDRVDEITLPTGSQKSRQSTTRTIRSRWW